MRSGLSVSLSKAAKLLGISYPTVKRLTDAGHLRFIKVGKQYHVHMNEIDRFKREGNYDPNRELEVAAAQKPTPPPSHPAPSPPENPGSPPHTVPEPERQQPPTPRGQTAAGTAVPAWISKLRQEG